MTATAASRQALGAYGETVAARHLVEQGMTLLERNWRCPVGEVDLVLREGHVLVVGKVKTRAGELGGSPHEAITPAKLERLQRLGEEWQVAHGPRLPEVRVDLVAVRLAARGAAEVEHVRGLV